MSYADLIATVLSLIAGAAAMFGSWFARRAARQERDSADPHGREIDRKELEEYAQMVAQVAKPDPEVPAPPATVLDRLRDRSERREKMLEKEINSNLRVRTVYQWTAFLGFALGLIPLIIGVWLVVIGAVPAGAVTAAVGAFVEITAVASSRASKDARETAESRVRELREAQSANDSYELALYSVSLIDDPEVRASILRELALKQAGIPKTD